MTVAVERSMVDSRSRILYIEDNLDSRVLIRRVLEAEGYAVLEAANGLEGLHQAEANAPHLVLIDINMPDVDGYTVTAKLREMPQLVGVPIVAVTANVMKGDREKTLAAGCDGFIPKPVDIDQLPAIISRFLVEARLT